MSNYHRNKERAKTKTVKPSLTDQSLGADTDVNKIIPKYLRTGVAHGNAEQPRYQDLSILPVGLRDTLEMARNFQRHRAKLPPELKDVPIEELTKLTRSELIAKLTPPQPAAKEHTNEDIQPVRSAAGALERPAAQREQQAAARQPRSDHQRPGE